MNHQDTRTAAAEQPHGLTGSESEPPQPVINFTREAREGHLGARRSLILVVLASLVLLDGMDTQMLGVIAHRMAIELSLPLSSFGVVFSSGLLGAIVGALVMSPLADRLLGRKRITVFAMATASLLTIATPFATNLLGLLAVRFVTGVGLGAAMPSIFTLAAEFSPQRFARLITSCLVAFVPLGSFLVGVSGRAVVPDFGWHMLMYVGGCLTLALTLLAAVVLPESVYFLLRIKNDTRKAAIAAKRLMPRLAFGTLVVDEADPRAEIKQPVARLFSPELWRFTLLIWMAFILNQGILYFVLSWTPALLSKSGLAITAGMNAAAMFGLGGAFGTVAQGWLASRMNIYKLMLVEMALYLIAILCMPLLLGNPILAPATVFFISFGMCAYNAGYILILIESYPNDIRTTGFGWAFGVGRIGATGAPVFAGMLVGLGWTAGQIFAAAALPGVISAFLLMSIALMFRRGHRKAASLTSAHG